MYRVLLAGCGNIGALYDFDNDHVLTHAKAFAVHPAFELTVSDIDQSLARKVADKYSAGWVENLNEIDLASFDCFIISTPTPTHTHLLERAFKSGVRMIVCEKPLSNNEDELNRLAGLYKESQSSVLVNYFRRFIPEYGNLAGIVQQIIREEQLTNISVRYQRGFVNNCSHALDLIQFLTGRTLLLTGITSGNRVFDSFETDPTLSFQARWERAFVDILGLADVKFSHFEIDLCFEYQKISIKDAGNTIEIYSAAKGTHFFQPLTINPALSMYNCLANYMTPVAAKVFQMLEKKQPDNFSESVVLNLNMLRYLNN